MRDEAYERVHVSLDILEQASTQGPGIRRGIVNIRGQLDRVTKGELTFAKEPTVQDPPQPDQAHTALSAPDSTSSDAALAAAGGSQDLAWLADGDLWDHQALMDILSAAPISTEDPFAFTDASLLPF